MNPIRFLNLIWDVADTHYTLDEARAKAAELGKRLPTWNDVAPLCSLPHAWDSKLNGMRLAENEADLGNPEKSLFLPAGGFYPLYHRGLSCLGEAGDYWLDSGLVLSFDYRNNDLSVIVNDDGKGHKLSVCYVQDVYEEMIAMVVPPAPPTASALSSMPPTDQCKLAIERWDFPAWANAFLNDNLQDEVAKIISAEVFVNENGNRRFVLMVRIGKYAYTAKGDSSREAAKHIVRAYYAPIVGEQEDTVNVVKIKVL